MMLCQDLNGKLVFDYRNIRMPLHGFDQAVLYFQLLCCLCGEGYGIPSVPFAVQVEFAFLVLSKSTPHLISSSICAGASRTTFSTAARSLIQSPAFMVSSMCLSKLSTSRLVTDATPPCAKYVLASSNPLFTDKSNFTFVRHFQRKTHTGNSGADNEEIEFSYHNFVISHRKATK